MVPDDKPGLSDRTRQSGFPYSDSTIGNISDVNAKNLGPFKARNVKNSWTDAPSEYCYFYDFLEDGLDARMTLTFSPFYIKTGTFDIRPAGNQLNMVNLSFVRL